MTAWDSLAQRMAAGEVVIIDGGMGSELEGRGVRMNDAAWCALANLDHLDMVQQIHEDYIGAGAEVIIANTYPTSRLLLRGAEMEDRFEEVNRRAVNAALSARQDTGRPDVAVAGSISLGVAVDFMHDGDGLPDPLLADAFKEQADLLAEAGVDLLALEMIMSPRYGVPAVEAALATGLPVWLGISVKLAADGSVVSLDGDMPVAELLAPLVDDSLAAVVVMHSSIAATGPALEAVAAAFPGRRGAYPESGDWTPPNWVSIDLPSEELVSATAGWVSEHNALLVGGCCGIGPGLIASLGEARASGRLRGADPTG